MCIRDRVKASYDSPEAVLSQLYGGESLTGWQNDQMVGYMNGAKNASTASGVLSSYRSAERLLTQNGVVLPLFYETSYYVTAPSVTGLRFSPFGCHVSFAEGRKKGCLRRKGRKKAPKENASLSGPFFAENPGFILVRLLLFWQKRPLSCFFLFSHTKTI